MTEEANNIEQRRESFYKQYNKEDPHSNWIFQPHTITMLLIGTALCTYVAFTRDESVSAEENIKYGLFAVAAMFLTFSAVQMRDGIFFRPHPMLWRFITGLAVLYLCAMVFLMFQSVTDARNLLKKLDPRLGVPLPERSYAEDCTLYTPHDKTSPFRNLMDTVNDEFIVAHLLGWFGKALLIRDVWLCWVMSILFEILEYTFEHMLPNFKECWWDHLILDVLVCNWLGIWLGFKVMKYFRMKHYDFVDTYNWEVLANWKRMVYAVLIIALISVIELNAFFLKFILWIPPPHPINIVRLLIWWGIGMPGLREFYHWAVDKNCKKFGPMSWLCVAIGCVETLICFKMGKGMFPAPHPKEVVYPWAIFTALFVLWALFHYGWYNKRKGKKTEVSSDTQFLVKGAEITGNGNGQKKKNKAPKKDQ